MKTTIKTLFVSLLTAIVLTSTLCTVSAQEIVKNFSNETVVQPFSMIQVNGNVKLHLRQGSKENIRMEANNERESITLCNKGQKLAITSSQFTPVDVYLTVKNLNRIEASGQTEIIASGVLNTNALQIFLSEDAIATINVKTSDLYTVIKDHSNLRLRGTSGRHVSVKEEYSKLNTVNFVALKTEAPNSFFTAINLDMPFIEMRNWNDVAFNLIK